MTIFSVKILGLILHCSVM